MNQTTSVGREIQKQYTITPHGGTVDIPKFTDTLHTAILFGMIEPAGTYWNICFCRNIRITIQHTLIQTFVILSFITNSYWVSRRPTRITRFSRFIPHPADISKRIRILCTEDNAIRLFFTDNLIPMTINRRCQFVGSRAVPPCFPYLTVITHQFAKLVGIIFLVAFGRI